MTRLFAFAACFAVAFATNNYAAMQGNQTGGDSSSGDKMSSGSYMSGDSSDKSSSSYMNGGSNDKSSGSYMSGGSSGMNAKDMSSGSSMGSSSENVNVNVDVSITVISSYAGGNSAVQMISAPTMNKGMTHQVSSKSIHLSSLQQR